MSRASTAAVTSLRRYLLDREMSDSQLSFRSQDDYISKYRRVLDYFDAVKIGLTATPALHTTDIFGPPIYRHSYREAAIDGYLVDHEPPVRIETGLAKAGIKFAKNERIELLNTLTGAVDLAFAPDEIRFDVEQFNKKVVTEAFNQVVAEELTKHIDPALPGKTLIFAATRARRHRCERCQEGVPPRRSHDRANPANMASASPLASTTARRLNQNPADSGTAILVRQVLGAIAEFEKATLVAKLAAARRRKRIATGVKVAGRKSHAELRPEVVKLAKALARKKPKGGKLSLRAISAELAARGFLNERGRPFNPKSVAAMLAS
jgi:hypothetical protein